MDLNLPKIGFDDDTEHDEEQNFLTDSVRTHYFKYMVKIINEVFLDPGKGEASDDVHKIAEYLELKAVRSCMVMDLYRKSILKTIGDIKDNDSALHQKIFISKIPTNKSKSVATQTEEIIVKIKKVEPEDKPIIEKPLSLDERIRQMENFQGLQGLPGMPEMKPFTYPSHSQTKRKPMKSEVPIKKEDNLEQEMNELFSTSSRASPADLFNVCGQQENDHQIDAIIKEIDNYHQPAKKIKVELDQENIIVKSKAKVVRSRAEKSKLKHSSWPYIYHLQKTNLRDVLTEVAENHIKYEKLKEKFDTLFGPEDDPDDEDNCDNLLGCPSSPSIDLDEENEILLGSCKQFQSEMVVENLMLYFNAGKIKDKMVFKKLAKHLTESISSTIQFPDELYIVNYINVFMENHNGDLTSF